MLRISTFFAVAFAIAGCDSFSTARVEADNSSSVPAGTGVNTPCVPQIYCRDADMDTYGDPNDCVMSCKIISGYAGNNMDCNDDPKSGGAIHPGVSESCDGVDNDCRGGVDDSATMKWYFDNDGDGRGNPASELSGSCNGLAKKYVANGDDCNDNDAEIFLGNPENAYTCDGKDNNCNGKTDEGVKSLLHADVDGDGHGSPDPLKFVFACGPSANVVVSNDDCDDADKNNFPGNLEVCDSKDNNCNLKIDDGDIQKTYYKDEDGDGYGTSEKPVQDCKLPVGATTSSNDCNDDPKTGKDVHPGVVEVCDEVDNNCNSVTDEGVQTPWHWDADGDGFANPNSKITLACSAPPGMALGLGALADCDDTDSTVYPGAPEVCDGKDNACAGLPMPPKEPDALCGDKNQFTNDFCLGTQGCVHEKQKFLMTCSNPGKFKASDGYTCGLVYYFGNALIDKTIVPIFEKEAASPLMEDVCIQLWNGKTLHVSAFVQLDFDPKFIWIESAFVKLIDSFTNKEILKTTPGNVILGETIEFDLTAADISACQ